MAEDANVREKAREAILAGRLPICRPAHVWAGRGEGGSCALCGKTIEFGDVEFEVDFPIEAKVEPGSCRLHRACFTAWELESNRSGHAGAQRSGELPSAPHEASIASREHGTSQRAGPG